MKNFSYLLLAGALLFIVTACGSHANYYNEPVDVPARYAYEQVSRRGNRGATRRGPVTRTVVPQNPHLPPGTGIAPNPSAPERVVTHSAAHPQGRVIQAPDSQRHYEPGPQAMQPIPYDPALQADIHTNPPVQTNTVRENPPATSAPSRSPALTTNNAGENENLTQPTSGRRELASHKTEFDSKDEGRTTNITRASDSINRKTIQPGEIFSYNETVGPTIERRGYKEGVIFVDGEKKKGFGGGVCQVSTTLSIAADEAGMTIIERHDHSLPVSYANEGEEAATSYGVIDFKFKNEKPFPVMINSSVVSGTITVSICEA